MPWLAGARPRLSSRDRRAGRADHAGDPRRGRPDGGRAELLDPDSHPARRHRPARRPHRAPRRRLPGPGPAEGPPRGPRRRRRARRAARRAGPARRDPGHEPDRAGLSARLRARVDAAPSGPRRPPRPRGRPRRPARRRTRRGPRHGRAPAAAAPACGMGRRRRAAPGDWARDAHRRAAGRCCRCPSGERPRRQPATTAPSAAVRGTAAGRSTVLAISTRAPP